METRSRQHLSHAQFQALESCLNFIELTLVQAHHTVLASVSRQMLLVVNVGLHSLIPNPTISMILKEHRSGLLSGFILIGTVVLEAARRKQAAYAESKRSCCNYEGSAALLGLEHGTEPPNCCFCPTFTAVSLACLCQFSWCAGSTPIFAFFFFKWIGNC